MSNKLKIILDCDDVLYPCNLTAVNRLNEEKHANHSINEITRWGLLHNELDERLKYFHDPDFIRNLQPFEGAKAFVKRLSNLGEVFIATSVESVCAGARIDSVLRDFPDINPSNILIGKRKDLLQAEVSLDDGLHHQEVSNVKYPVLYRQPWNKSSSGALTVSTYDEFIEFVQMIQRRNTEIHPESSVYVLVGPTGGGKNEVVKELTKEDDFVRVKPYSTKCGKTYHTVYFEQFEEMKANGFFIETSYYAGHEYGTSKEKIDEIIGNGKKAILLMDINGAISMKQLYQNDCVLIFISKSKRECIRSILTRDMTIEEKCMRLESLDAEFKNEEFCDISMKGMSDIAERIKEVANYGWFC